MWPSNGWIEGMSGSALAAVVGWLARRRAARLWRTWRAVWTANQRLTDCELSLASVAKSRDLLATELDRLTQTIERLLRTIPSAGNSSSMPATPDGDSSPHSTASSPPPTSTT